LGSLCARSTAPRLPILPSPFTASTTVVPTKSSAALRNADTAFYYVFTFSPYKAPRLSAPAVLRTHTVYTAHYLRYNRARSLLHELQPDTTALLPLRLLPPHFSRLVSGSARTTGSLNALRGWTVNTLHTGAETPHYAVGWTFTAVYRVASSVRFTCFPDSPYPPTTYLPYLPLV